MHWVAHDTEFLRETLANTIEVDEFTRNLFKIHERVLADDDAAKVHKRQEDWAWQLIYYNRFLTRFDLLILGIKIAGPFSIWLHDRFEGIEPNQTSRNQHCIRSEWRIR